MSDVAVSKPRTPGRHIGQCGVCNHPEKAAIEKAYLDHYQSCRQIGEDFGLSDDSVWNHVTYFGLNRKRVEHTAEIYKQIASKGIQQMESGVLTKLKDGTLARIDIVVNPKTVVQALAQLDKITGAEQEPQKNARDRELAAKRIESLIEKTIKMLEERNIFIGITTEQEKRAEAIKLLREYEPELMELLPND